MLDDADRIWNRACDPFAAQVEAGDRALQALLLVHGQLMNGGLVSALEYNAPEEIRSAVAGFQYFLLDRAAHALDDEYCAEMSSDAVLERAFRARLRESPGDFACLN